MHGFIMARKGRVFAEGYYAPFHKDYPHRMYSISKSLTSIAIGMLQEEGKLSLGDDICRFFPDKLPPGGAHPYIIKTTIRDMLRMATPHKGSTTRVMDDDDWVKTFFHVKPVKYPGSSFAYDTSSTHVLSALVERLSGQTLLEYLSERLFRRIGLSPGIRWLTCPMGICQGGSGLICTLRDMAQIGLVIMNGGKLHDDQIIPAAYIKEATVRQIETPLQPYIEEQQGYGYQFWRCRNGGYALYGLGGQLVICLPQYDFLLVTGADTQGNPNGVTAIFEALWGNILPYLKDGLHGKPAAEEGRSDKSLNEKLENLSIMTVENLCPIHREKEVSGTSYVFPRNSLGIISCRFAFEREKSRGCLIYENSSGKHSLSFGLGFGLMQKIPGTEYDSFISGGWIEENKLQVTAHGMGDDLGRMNFTATFIDNSLTIAAKSAGGMTNLSWEGFASGEEEIL